MEAGPGINGIRHDFELFKLEMQRKDALKRAQSDQRDIEKRAAKLKKQQESRRQLKRAAHYLSVRSIVSSVDVGASTLRNRKSRQPEQSLPTFFVSVDVEAFERDQKCITEIGISTLDTEDLIGTTSGGTGSINWGEKIVSRHFRIREYGHLRNKAFVEGCPADFCFGKSDWLKEMEAPSAIRSCFTPAAPVSTGDGAKRVVLVAHNVEADIKYLQSLGLQPLALANDFLDTSNLYQALRRQDRQPSLASVLLDLGIAAKYLHNAGNDARYTLQAMLTMAYEYTNVQKLAHEWKNELEARVKIAVREAETRVRVDFQGWESSEEEELNLLSPINKTQERSVAGARAGMSQDPKSSCPKGNTLERVEVQTTNQGSSENSDRYEGMNHERRSRGQGRRGTQFGRRAHQRGF